MTRRQNQRAACDLYISHGAPRAGGLDWFIVKPGPVGTVDEEVQRLLEAGRTVYRLAAKPRLTERLMRKTPITLKPTGLAPRRRPTTKEATA